MQMGWVKKAANRVDFRIYFRTKHQSFVFYYLALATEMKNIFVVPSRKSSAQCTFNDRCAKDSAVLLETASWKMAKRFRYFCVVLSLPLALLTIFQIIILWKIYLDIWNTYCCKYSAFYELCYYELFVFFFLELRFKI